MVVITLHNSVTNHISSNVSNVQWQSGLFTDSHIDICVWGFGIVFRFDKVFNTLMKLTGKAHETFGSQLNPRTKTVLHTTHIACSNLHWCIWWNYKNLYLYDCLYMQTLQILKSKMYPIYFLIITCNYFFHVCFHVDYYVVYMKLYEGRLHIVKWLKPHNT